MSPVDYFPDSGSLILDMLVLIGGYPYRGPVQIYGEPKEGKSTMAIACAAENSRKGLRVEYYDFECKMSIPGEPTKTPAPTTGASTAVATSPSLPTSTAAAGLTVRSLTTPTPVPESGDPSVIEIRNKYSARLK